jgi:hypothetical protein
MSLGENDPIENAVESPIAAAVETMADESGRRGLKRCGAGVGGELRISVESATRPNDARQGASGQEVDAAETCQRLEPYLSEFLDSCRQFGGLVEGELEARGQSPYGCGPRFCKGCLPGAT